jgi:hypothetical protein
MILRRTSNRSSSASSDARRPVRIYLVNTVSCAIARACTSGSMSGMWKRYQTRRHRQSKEGWKQICPTYGPGATFRLYRSRRIKLDGHVRKPPDRGDFIKPQTAIGSPIVDGDRG